MFVNNLHLQMKLNRHREKLWNNFGIIAMNRPI